MQYCYAMLILWKAHVHLRQVRLGQYDASTTNAAKSSITYVQHLAHHTNSSTLGSRPGTAFRLDHRCVKEERGGGKRGRRCYDQTGRKEY